MNFPFCIIPQLVHGSFSVDDNPKVFCYGGGGDIVPGGGEGDVGVA